MKYIELIKYLDNNDIVYEHSNLTNFIILEVFTDEPYWNELENILKLHDKTPTIVEKIYTKKELNNAEWFEIGSTYRLGYPQPEDEYKHITYDDSNYCPKCGGGLVQKDSFYINKLPKFKSRNFYQPYWIEDELFVSTKVVDKFKEEKITGIEILDVKKYRKNETIDFVKQIKINEILPKGLIINENELEKEIICGKCGKLKYIVKGSTVLRFKRNLFNDKPNFVKTYEQFGDGRICARDIIVSKRVYDIIISNNLGRGLIFEPIELI